MILASTSREASRFAFGVGAAGAVLLALWAWRSGQAWQPSYLFAWLFLVGISLGSLALVAVHDLTGGGWGVAARPFLDAAVKLFPVQLVLGLPLLIRADTLFPWMHAAGDAAPGAPTQAWYLNPGFFWLRAAIYFAVWIALSRVLGRARGADGRGSPAAAAASFLLYAVTMTYATIDWIMSLAPEWHSTVFGLLIGVGQALAALSGAIVFASNIGHQPSAEQRGRSHDLGKLLFALVMVWAYLAFMQFLIIWIEDLPDEIRWYLVRTGTSWGALTAFVVLAHFVLPFFALLSARLKQVPSALAWVAICVFLGCIADTYWLVVPGFRPDGFALSWGDLFSLMAVAGICRGFVLHFMRTAHERRGGGAPSGTGGGHAAQHA